MTLTLTLTLTLNPNPTIAMDMAIAITMDMVIAITIAIAIANPNPNPIAITIAISLISNPTLTLTLNPNPHPYLVHDAVHPHAGVVREHCVLGVVDLLVLEEHICIGLGLYYVMYDISLKVLFVSHLGTTNRSLQTILWGCFFY